MHWIRDRPYLMPCLKTEYGDPIDVVFTYGSVYGQMTAAGLCGPAFLCKELLPAAALPGLGYGPAGRYFPNCAAAQVLRMDKQAGYFCFTSQPVPAAECKPRGRSGKIEKE